MRIPLSSQGTDTGNLIRLDDSAVAQPLGPRQSRDRGAGEEGGGGGRRAQGEGGGGLRRGWGTGGGGAVGEASWWKNAVRILGIGVARGLKANRSSNPL